MDPTAGEGNFLEGFIKLASQKSSSDMETLVHRLYGVEKEERFVAKFHKKIAETYHVKFPERHFIHGDILFDESHIKADIIVGNPPWMNFTDLPNDYKELIKPLFHKYDLITDSQKLLLGGARIDIAALIISKTLKENLKQRGSAYYFMPLSILLNDGAHQAFRSYAIHDTPFCVKEVYDFLDRDIFDGVSTRYGLVHFERDQTQSFPIPFFIFKSNQWFGKYAKPLFNPNDPLTVFEDKEHIRELDHFEKIRIPKSSKPRQGVNTCGANSVFIFNELEHIDQDKVGAGNKENTAILPKQFVHPLLVKHNFNQDVPIPERWVLLPHDESSGKPLPLALIKTYPSLYEYLIKHKERLKNRKGSLIQSWIKKGFWWALLGVGPYSFQPYKVFWESYGKRHFTPKLFFSKGHEYWQGNQAMHAFISMADGRLADNVLRALKNPVIECYLKSLRMEGTCNWAQPGKISKLLDMDAHKGDNMLPLGF